MKATSKKTTSIEETLPKYQNYLVSKRNDLITTGRFDLSLNEQKILLILTSTIQPTDETLTKQTFRAIDLANLLNITPQAMYQELPKLTRKLLRCYIEVEFEGVLIQANLLSSARYERGSGRVTLTLSDDLKPFYLQLQNHFTSYQLKYILRLNSKYSIRFYEFFQCALVHGGFLTTIDELRMLMALTQKSYQRYADFNRKVLKPAITEINELTDLEVSYCEIKEGRRVVSLDFKVKRKKAKRKKKSPLDALTPEQLEALENLKKEVTLRTGQLISSEEALLIQEKAQKTNLELFQALHILNPKTENPVGALLDYFKTPKKYEHLQNKKNQLALPLPEEPLVPKPNPTLDQLSDEEKVAYMKSLQAKLLTPLN